MSEDTEDDDSDNVTINFCIRIVNEDGEGIEDVKVFVTYYVGTDFEDTDDDGWAYFSKLTMLDKLMQGGTNASEIGVGSEVLAEDVWLEDGDSFSYTLSDD